MQKKSTQKTFPKFLLRYDEHEQNNWRLMPLLLLLLLLIKIYRIFEKFFATAFELSVKFVGFLFFVSQYIHFLLVLVWYFPILDGGLKLRTQWKQNAHDLNAKCWLCTQQQRIVI